MKKLQNGTFSADDPHAIVEHLFSPDNSLSVAIVRLKNGERHSAALVLNGAPDAGHAMQAVNKLIQFIEAGGIADVFETTRGMRPGALDPLMFKGTDPDVAEHFDGPQPNPKRTLH